ncbi:hypothetical protein [Pseudoxanthomonas sp.]|uniref:hypothetical protein n=1 Tax=Pseudoxanthomonas sp. TaxID=1871049 RepID=UPI00262C4522|nr:hypothetical protein [Pseudoxanthomonas sp.]WDS35309.1 MAG: hypothetical protein O8I58_13230 [Pseudoxanthomonas sp.]
MTLDPEQLAEQHVREFAGPQDLMLRQAGRALEAAVQHLPEAEQIAFADRYMERLARLTLPQSRAGRPSDAIKGQPPVVSGLLGDADPRTQRSRFRLLLPMLVILAVIVVLLIKGVGAQ